MRRASAMPAMGGAGCQSNRGARRPRRAPWQKWRTVCLARSTICESLAKYP